MKTGKDIFVKNFEALEKRYPELAERVRCCKVVNYELFQQAGCIMNVRNVVTKEPWYKGTLQEFFDTQWKGLKFDKVKMPIFLGFGLGYESQYFFSQYGEKFCVQGAIVIERDLELFVLAMNVIDITMMLENIAIHFIVGIPQSDMYVYFREFFRYNMKEILFSKSMFPIFIDMPFKHDKAYYIESFQSMLSACWDSLYNFGNCPEDSLIGIENMLDNVKEIVNNPGINLLYDAFKNKPAIVIATGPSLKKNMHLLKDLEDKALLISVDASFKYLLDNGIKPHLVTSLEREHGCQELFDNIDPETTKDIYMAACPVIYNHVYEAYTGPKVIVYRMFDHFKWLGIDKGMLDIKLSASNMAFKVAEALGCDPIILVGQDLAYGDNGETHVVPVPFSSEGENMLAVKGNVQDEVKTNDGWFNFLKAFEVDISTYAGKCFNCTEGGAFIKGTYVEPLQKLIDYELQTPFYPLGLIKEKFKEFNTIKEDADAIKTLFDKTIADIEAIVRLCKEGMLLDPELPIQDLVVIRTKIIKEYSSTFQLFLMHVLQAPHLALEMQLIVGNNRILDWYYYIGQISAICLDSLKKAKGKLEDG